MIPRPTPVYPRVSRKAEWATCGNTLTADAGSHAGHGLWRSGRRETEDTMLSVVFTWAAAVVGLLVLALMALSGVMIDSKH